MPSPADVAALQSVLADLSTLTIRDLVELWRRYSDNPDFRVIVEAAFPEIVGQYAAAGALASAQWYDEMAPDLDYRAVPVVDLPAERFTKTIGWSLYAPGQATPLDRMAGAAQRMIFDASRQTMLTNLDTEYGSASEVGTRWARYASATACGFCRMLATRKAVYRSAESATRVVGRSTELTVSDRRIRAAGLATTDELLARRDVYERNTRWGSKGEKKIKALRGNTSRGSRYHDNCRCVAVPVRPGQAYEPPDYVARWEDEYLAARDAGARTPGEIAAAMDKAEGGRRAPRGDGGGGKPPGGGPGGKTGFGDPGDAPDPSREVDHSLAKLTDAEIRDRVRAVRMPVIDPANPPRGLRIYGDGELELDNDAIAHVAYGLTTQGIEASRQTGHIWGIPAPRNTWFLKGQEPQDLADILGKVLESPDYYLPVVKGRNDRRILLKNIDGVLYQAMWYPAKTGKLVFSSMFPKGGVGVFAYSGPPDELTPRPLPTAGDLARLGFVAVESQS